VMIPVSLVMGWLDSVTYVSALSLWALVAGHWSTWQAARVEVAQQAQIDAESKHPVEERVVEKIVDETDVDKVDGRSGA
jgi:membrane protein required for beta-lactamase induction